MTTVPPQARRRRGPASMRRRIATCSKATFSGGANITTLSRPGEKFRLGRVRSGHAIAGRPAAARWRRTPPAIEVQNLVAAMAKSPRSACCITAGEPPVPMATVACVKAATMPRKVMVRPTATKMLAHHSSDRAGPSKRPNASAARTEVANLPSSSRTSMERQLDQPSTITGGAVRLDPMILSISANRLANVCCTFRSRVPTL